MQPTPEESETGRMSGSEGGRIVIKGTCWSCGDTMERTVSKPPFLEAVGAAPPSWVGKSTYTWECDACHVTWHGSPSAWEAA
jgi:hypothetical protein